MDRALEELYAEFDKKVSRNGSICDNKMVVMVVLCCSCSSCFRGANTVVVVVVGYCIGS